MSLSFIESRYNKIMSEESSMESEEFGSDTGAIIGYISFVFGSFFLCNLYHACLYYKKEEDQENLEMIERQDQVIKTYQIAKMIVSGTAFESLQLKV